MEYFLGGILGILAFVFLITAIISIKKSENTSKFMRDILIFMLTLILLVSISVTAHYFYSSNSVEKSKLNLAVMLVVQGLMISVGFFVRKFNK